MLAYNSTDKSQPSNALSRSWSILFANGVQADVLRLGLLWPLLYLATGYGMNSSAPSVIIAFALSISILSYRLARERRDLPRWCEKKYREIRDQLDGLELEDLDCFTDQREGQIHGVRKHLQKGIRWADPEKKTTTEWTVIFIHGFSSARLECSPLFENIADHLNANMYFARLPGHGLEEGVIADFEEDQTFKGYLQETVEALAIGQCLGEKVLLCGSSCGSILSAYVASQLWLPNCVKGIVGVSLAIRPCPVLPVKYVGWIPIIRELILWGHSRGYMHQCHKRGLKGEDEFRTWIYPAHLPATVFDVAESVQLRDPSLIKVPLLGLVNPKDHVVSFEEAERWVARVPQGKLVAVHPLETEQQHMIISAATAPSTVEFAFKEVKNWMQSLE